MNTFNRALVLGFAVIVIVCCVVIDAVAAGLLPLQAFAGAPWIADRLAPFAASIGAVEIETLIVCTGLLLLGFILVAFEIGSLSANRRPLVVDQAGLGHVSVDEDLVRAMAAREAAQVPGVTASRLRVLRDQDGFRIHGNLSLAPVVNVAAVSQQVQARIKTALERSLGQPVEEVRLRCVTGVPQTAAPLAGRGTPTGLPEGDGAMQASPPGIFSIIDRIGPVSAAVGATLAVILGILIIVYPVLLAWVVGIGLIVAGVAVFFSILTKQ